MPDNLEFLRAVREISARKGVFRPEAYLFVMECLEIAMAQMEVQSHISGDDLLAWIRKLGEERYGVMTADVFRGWGVRGTVDFGRVVFHLVEEGLLRKRDDDTLSDFIDKFDFEDAFSLQARDGLKARKGRA